MKQELWVLQLVICWLGEAYVFLAAALLNLVNDWHILKFLMESHSRNTRSIIPLSELQITSSLFIS